MLHIWTYLNTKHPTIKYAKPLTNTFNAFSEYYIVVPEGRSPHHWKYEQTQDTSDFFVMRTIPFPFPRATPATILCGLAGLDFGTSKDAIATLQDGSSTNTGFASSLGSTLLRDLTDCNAMGINWMDIAPRHNQFVHHSYIGFGDTINPTVATKIIPDVPDRFKETNGKLLSSTRLVCWLAGFNLERGKDFNIVPGAALSDVASAKIDVRGNTHMKWEACGTSCIRTRLTFRFIARRSERRLGLLRGT